MNMERTLLMIGLFKVTRTTRPVNVNIYKCLMYTHVGFMYTHMYASCIRSKLSVNISNIH